MRSNRIVDPDGGQWLSAKANKEKEKLVNTTNFILPPNQWTTSMASVPLELGTGHIYQLSGGAAEKHRGQGYNMFKCNKVLECKFNSCQEEAYMGIKSSVQASFSVNEKYRVKVVLSKLSGDILFTHCTCKSGAQGKCKHTVATLYQVIDYKDSGITSVPEETACTEKTRQWGKGGKNSKITEKFADLVFVHYQPGKDSTKTLNNIQKRQNYCAIPPIHMALDKERIQALANSFKGGNQSMWAQILEEDLQKVQNKHIYLRGQAVFLGFIR